MSGPPPTPLRTLWSWLLSLPPMAADEASPSPSPVARWWRIAGRERVDDVAEGVERNRRVTAVTGFILFPLLVLVTLTGWQFGSLWRIHYLIGFLLIPPLILKLASTSYRFVRYYSGNPAYVHAGPPAPLLRILAPLLVADVIVVMVSGVVLYAEHSQDGLWSSAHSISVFFSIFLVAVHVAWYLPAATRETRGDARAGPGTPRGVGRRRTLVIGTLVAGLVLGGVTAVAAQQPTRRARLHDGLGRPPTGAAVPRMAGGSRTA